MAERNLHMTAVGNPLGVLHSLPRIGEKPLHLLLALHIILAALVAQAVFVSHLLSRLQTEQNIVGLGVLRISVVHVVGDHKRNVQLLVHAKKHGIDRLLRRNPVILQFQKVIIFPENILIF